MAEWLEDAIARARKQKPRGGPRKLRDALLRANPEQSCPRSARSSVWTGNERSQWSVYFGPILLGALHRGMRGGLTFVVEPKLVTRVSRKNHYQRP